MNAPHLKTPLVQRPQSPLFYTCFLLFCFVFGPFNDVRATLSDTVTVRLANPRINCENNTYTVDVEFKCSVPNKRIFGGNFRFFYDYSMLAFNSFVEFQGHYAAFSPNPPVITNPSPVGPLWFNFPNNSVYVNGAFSLTNFSSNQIFMPTNGYVKLFAIQFSIEGYYPSITQDCPPIVLDAEYDPSAGGFIPNSGGIVLTIVASGNQSEPVSRKADQFNWAYNGSNTAPFGAPVSNDCLDGDCGSGGCDLVVTNTLNSGAGSLRDIIECAPIGSTITFAPALAGQTINISAPRILINKNVTIDNNNGSRVKIASVISSGQGGGMFDVAPGKTVVFENLDLTSASSGTDGAAIKNQGSVTLNNVSVFKHTALPSSHYVIRNYPGTTLLTKGLCKLEN